MANVRLINPALFLPQKKGDLFAFQPYSAKIWDKQKCLNGIIEEIYKQQIRSEYIRPDILKSINNITTIRDRLGQPIFNIQFNPAREKRGESPNPNPSPVHILPGKKIPCFCCAQNIETQWPKERGFEFIINNKPYILVANPAPIFDKHFTLVSKEHRPMKMDIDLLTKVSQITPNMWVVQNGEGAGASNPWHFHLQLFSGDQKFPIEAVPAKDTYVKHFPQKQKLVIEKLDYPMHIYRLKFNQLSQPLLNYLTYLQNKFLKINPNNNLNYVIKKNSRNEFELYFILRSVDKISPLYAGAAYAEPLGVVIATKESDKEAWTSGKKARFHQMLSDISVEENIYEKFNNSLIQSLH
jgi:hypothetical protein